MQNLLATVTDRGQVTIPAAVRRHLRVNAGAKIVFQIDDEGRVHVTPAPYTFETVRASVGPLKSSLSAEEIAEAVDEARTQRYRRTLADSTR